MKLLLDMNLSPRWVEWFTDSGIEAVHWSTTGPGDATDSEIMAYAKRHDFVVITHDLDFGAILAATGGEKPSVVQLRSDDLRPTSIGGAVLTALRQMELELAQGALLTVDIQRTRIRLLPLKPR